jgi:hypothetical protein
MRPFDWNLRDSDDGTSLDRRKVPGREDLSRVGRVWVSIFRFEK